MSYVNLGEVCDFQGGTQPPKSEWKSERVDGYIRMLQIRDFTQQQDKHIEYVKDTKKLRKCNSDDILIGRYGASVGKILSGLGGAYNVAIIKTVPIESKLSKKYLYYFLLNPRFQNFIKNIGGRAAQQGFNKEDISDYKIYLPPLPDQLHIANLLSKAENLIAQRKESIRLLDEFLKSTFLEMFGNTRHYTNSDAVKTIGEICNTRGGGTPSKAKPEYYTGEIPWVSPKDMKWLYITTSQDKITQQAIDESSTALIPKGSLLMVIRSGILKSKLPLAINKVDVTINQDMKAFTSKEVTTEYLLYFFFSEERNILKKVKGTTADNLNFDDIKKMKIKIPPLELQTQFAQIVEKTEALKTQYQQSLQELENLYGSLSQKAFRGELTINKAVSV